MSLIPAVNIGKATQFYQSNKYIISNVNPQALVLQNLFNICADGFWCRGRRPTVDNDTLLVNQEFLEVPLFHPVSDVSSMNEYFA